MFDVVIITCSEHSLGTVVTIFIISHVISIIVGFGVDISAHHPSINEAVKLVKQGNYQTLGFLEAIFKI